MVKQFKGQVKISDVQTAFDDIVAKINSLVTSYNAQSYVEEIDYTVGGTTLAPSGYTLTVGGYKQFLKACEGVVTGCKPIKVDDNHFKVTTGMLVARNGIFRLPDSILAIPTDTSYRKLYYNPYTLAYQWTGWGTISYTETKEVQLGSNMYQNVKDDITYYGMNSQAYSDYRTNDTLLRGVGRDTIEGETRSDLVFSKYYNDDPISSDNQSFKLRINDYPLVIIEDNEIKSNDTMIINWFNKESINNMIIQNDYYGSNPINLCFGTLSTDGITFTPKFGLSAHTSYPNNNEAKLKLYTYDKAILYGEEVCARFNNDAYSEGSFSTDYDVNWKLGDGISKFKFIHDDETDSDYIEVYQSIDELFTLKSSVRLPQEISTYDINCIIPFTTLHCNQSDTIYDSYGSNYASYILDANFLKVEASGTEFGINTESRKATITTVVTEESDTAAYRVCDINPNCTSDYIGTVHNAQVEDIDGTYEITNENKDYSGYWNGWADWNAQSAPWYEKLDTSEEPKFVIGMPSCTGGGSKHGVGSTEYAYLFGEEVYKMVGQRDRAGISYCPSTWLYIPKGVSNPYTYYSGYHNSNDPKWSKQKVLDVEIERDIEDTSG